MKQLHIALNIAVNLALAGIFLLGGALDIPSAAVSAPAADASAYVYPLPPVEDDLPPTGCSAEDAVSSEPVSSEEASSEPVSSEPSASSDTYRAPVSSQPASSAVTSSQPTAPKPSNTNSGRYVVGYYPSWARGSGLPAAKLDASLLTHINYAFADISAQNTLVLPHPTTDRQNFADLRALKRENPHLKTLISVGGWDYSGNFSRAAKTASSRETFAQSCADFVAEHGFDGIDLDWEFPAASDKRNFTLLLEAIRAKLDEQGRRDGKYYSLTIAWSPSTSLLSRIEAGKVAAIVDYIFLMGYDIHGPWDSYADFNAPLYPSGEASPHYSLSLSEAVSAWQKAGIPAGKIVLGMPFYGYLYTTNGSTPQGYFSRFSSAKSISYDKIVSGYLGNSAYIQRFHDSFRTPYLYNGSTFLSYDDEASIAEKARFARESGLAGIGAWELSQDKNARLLRSAYNALHS